MQEETNMATEQTSAKETVDSSQIGEKLSNRNLFMYALGTLGRDFLYNLFNGYLLSFCEESEHGSIHGNHFYHHSGAHFRRIERPDYGRNR